MCEKQKTGTPLFYHSLPFRLKSFDKKRAEKLEVLFAACWASERPRGPRVARRPPAARRACPCSQMTAALEAAKEHEVPRFRDVEEIVTPRLTASAYASRGLREGATTRRRRRR